MFEFWCFDGVLFGRLIRHHHHYKLTRSRSFIPFTLPPALFVPSRSRSRPSTFSTLTLLSSLGLIKNKNVNSEMSLLLLAQTKTEWISFAGWKWLLINSRRTWIQSNFLHSTHKNFAHNIRHLAFCRSATVNFAASFFLPLLYFTRTFFPT